MMHIFKFENKLENKKCWNNFFETESIWIKLCIYLTMKVYNIIK